MEYRTNVDGLNHLVSTEVGEDTITVSITRLNSLGGKVYTVTRNMPISSTYKEVVSHIDNITSLNNSLFIMCSEV